MPERQIRLSRDFSENDLLLMASKAIVQTWVLTTDEGRAWLSEMAAHIGAPLQLTLPLAAKREGS